MTISPKELYDLSDKELLERMGGAQPNSIVAYAVESEFRRRALISQIEAARSSKAAADAAKSTAVWTRFSAVAIAISVAITAIAVLLPANPAKQADPQKIVFDRKFEKEAVLVKTCPRDPRYATGPNAVATRVYSFENKLWYDDVDGPRNVEGAPETVCDALKFTVDSPDESYKLH